MQEGGCHEGNDGLHPPGWLHASFANEDTVIFSGTFAFSADILRHLMNHDLEKKLDVSFFHMFHLKKMKLYRF